MWPRSTLRRNDLTVTRRRRTQIVVESLESRTLLTGSIPALPQHNPSLRIAELAYQNTPLDSFSQGLLANNVDLVIPDNSNLGQIHQIAPNTPALIYTNLSNIYSGLLTDWLTYADSHGLSREGAFYHASTPTAFSGNSASSRPVNWFWNVYESNTRSPDLTWAAHDTSSSGFSLGSTNQPLSIGYLEKFHELDFSLVSGASNWQAQLEYPTAVDSNGVPTTWASLKTTSDTTAGLTQSGQVTFDPPANWVTASINGSALMYYVRLRTTTSSGTAPVVKTLMGRDYVGAKGTYSGTIPVFDYSADTNHDGYLNDAEWAKRTAGDDARFVYETRVFAPAYGQMRFATNPADTDFQAWAVDYEQRYLAQNPDAGGLFIDNSGGWVPVNGTKVLESATTYSSDFASLIGAVDQAISPRFSVVNISGGYHGSSDPVVQADGFAFVEFMIRPLSQDYNYFETNAKAVTHNLSLSSPSPDVIVDSMSTGGSPTDPRTQIATLAEYYLMADPNSTMLMFYGGQSPSSSWTQHWSPAAAYDIGKPDASWSVFATGTDPSNSLATYKVYQRPYDNALVLYKPLSYQNSSVQASIGDETATTVALNGSYRLLNADGTLGPVQSSVTLRNGEGAILIPVPAPPVDNNDSYLTAGNTPLQVTAPGVLANDRDAHPNLMTAVLDSGPTHGQLKLNADGSFSYTPQNGFHGTDSFTYHANEGSFTGNTATVSLVVDTPPQASNQSYAVLENNSLSIAASGVLKNATDADGDPLTAVLVSGPSDGTLAFHSDGSFVYNPNAGFSGTDTFTYQASDGFTTGNTATVTVTVNSTNLVTLLSESFDTTQVGTLPAGWSQWSSENWNSFSATADKSQSPANGLATSVQLSSASARAWYAQTEPADVRVSSEVYVSTLIPVQVLGEVPTSPRARPPTMHFRSPAV